MTWFTLDNLINRKYRHTWHNQTFDLVYWLLSQTPCWRPSPSVYHKLARLRLHSSPQWVGVWLGIRGQPRFPALGWQLHRSFASARTPSWSLRLPRLLFKSGSIATAVPKAQSASNCATSFDVWQKNPPADTWHRVEPIDVMLSLFFPFLPPKKAEVPRGVLYFLSVRSGATCLIHVRQNIDRRLGCFSGAHQAPGIVDGSLCYEIFHLLALFGSGGCVVHATRPPPAFKRHLEIRAWRREKRLGMNTDWEHLRVCMDFI